MEYLIPLLIVVLVAVVVGGGAWLLSRRASRSSAGGAGAAGSAGSAGAGGSAAAGSGRSRRPSLAQRVSADGARAASTRLDQASHREVYRLIAAGRTAEAITAYRRTTGAGTFEAMLDVQALAAFPQVWEASGPQGPGGQAPGSAGPVSQESGNKGSADAGTAPGGSQPGGSQPSGARSGEAESGGAEPGGAESGGPGLGAAGAPGQPGAPGQGSRSGRQVPPSDIADATDLVVPEDWLGERLPADRPFELEVVRDETTVRVSSDDLPPFLRDQLTALVRDGRVEDAALELSAHTVLTAEEALQFLHILQREQGTDD